MKTVQILLLPLFCFLTINLSAQFSVGLKAGYVDAWEDYGDVILPEDAETHIKSFQISSLVYYNLKQGFEIGLEPGYVGRGAACVPGSFSFETPERRLYLSYLEVPLLLKGEVSLFKGNVSLFAKVGVGCSKILWAYQEEEKQIGFGNATELVRLEVLELNVKSWDFGTYTGAGLGVNIGKGQIFTEARYYRSLVDAVAETTSLNRSLEYSLGYMKAF